MKTVPVLIPNKDALLILARAARTAIARCNAAQPALPPEDRAMPHFPLWAVLNGEPAGISGVSVGAPTQGEGTLFFPVRFSADGVEKVARIVFATYRAPVFEAGSALSAPEVREVFPLAVRVFRTGSAVFENNGWQLFDDRWHKG